MNTVAEKPNQCCTPASELPFAAPEVNIYETEKSFVLQAELPGVSKEGLEVTLEGSTLTFVGRRADVAKGTPLYRETRPLNYRRSFELDPSVDTDKVVAEIHQGVLTLTLPKAERVQPRKIQIK
jgi:HSP20 family protein